MQIILTKEEYDDLVKRATSCEVTSEEKFEELKKKLRQMVGEEYRRAGDTFRYTPQDLLRFLQDHL